MNRHLLVVCLLAALIAVCPRAAHAGGDVVQFGSTIHVARDATVHDAVCFFCDVNAEGTVEGDLVVFFGSVHLGSNANHDVVDFFGNVTADDNAHIGQGLVSMFGSVRLGEDVSIGKDLVVMFGSFRSADSVVVGGERVVQPAWVFWGPLFVIALVIILVVHEIRTHRQRAYMRYPIPPRT